MENLNDLLKNKNSIGFLRLMSAWLVLIGHSVPFGNFGEDPLLVLTNNQIALGRFPVDLFFALSGFLIFSSYDRLNNLMKFLWHRFLRIYPAFWVCLIITAIFIPLAIGFEIDWHYLYSNSTLLILLDSSIGNIGLNNNINSALWTLPWELRAYLIIALLGVLKILNKKFTIPIILLVCYSYFIYEIVISPANLETNKAVTSGFRLFTFFFIGSFFYLFRHKIIISTSLFVTSLVIIILAIIAGNYFYHHSAGFYYIFGPVPFTYIVFYLAKKLPFHTINTKTDISYGVYIYGSLVLNLLTYYNMNQNYLVYLFSSIAITTIVSYLCWILIEKKSMNFKNKLFN